MSIELSVLEQLRAGAKLVATTFREKGGTELAFELSGVKSIDSYIEQIRKDFPAGRRSGLVNNLASFLGECIIRAYGGEWVEKNGELCVQVSARLCASPFAKVDKQFENGATDSVAVFFLSIPIIDQHLNQVPTARKDSDNAAVSPGVHHYSISSSIGHKSEEA